MEMLYWFAVLITVALLAAMFNPWRYQIRVRNYTVQVNGLPDNFKGFTILQLTDLHSKRFGQRQRRLINLVREQQFDILALTGDFVNKFNPDAEPFLQLMQGIHHKPMYFVPGNHEGRTGFKYKNKLSGFGVRLLENDAEKIFRDGQYLWVVGVDDPHLGKDRLDEALIKTDPGGPKVLLAHSPTIFSEAVKNGVDLMLAGHTHGGQVRLPFFGALFVPGQGLFPKWDYGMYKRAKTTMIISGGLGESDLPFRFNIMPELVLIKLVNNC